MATYIFGAKATAAGLYRALRVLGPEKCIRAFLVSKAEGNVPEIFGCPVRILSEVAGELSENDKTKSLVYVAVPELIHKEIKELLDSFGFRNTVMVDSYMEADIMERYFNLEGKFQSVHSLTRKGKQGDIPKLTIYAASFYKDKPLVNPPVWPKYVKKLYLGCEGAAREGIDIAGKADFYDNTDENISSKNPNRCEMTAHYWVWKNRLDTDDEYVGICHYRRMLDLSDEDISKIAENDVDIVLPYPMIHYPNAGIQHTWYVPESDWDIMKQAVCELHPEYADMLGKIFGASEFYNYNILLAKKQVFSDYCEWLYPILDRIEEISVPKGEDRHDRYTAYMSESLETLYFMANLKGLKICHTGRILYT